MGRTCLGCRLGRAWTQPTGLQAPTTRTAQGAAVPCCQILPHTNEKSQVPHKRYLTFLAGAEGLGLGCRLGRFAAERHWRSLTSRHAVLEWMWESAPGSGKRPMSSGSLRKSQRGRCWFGAVSSFWRRIVYRLPLLPSKEKHLRQEDGQADQDHGRVGPGGI